MKQIITTVLFSAIAVSCMARSASERKSILTMPKSSVNAASMDVRGNSMVFTGLPGTSAELYLMDANGNVEKSTTVSRRHNIVDLSAIPDGNHIVALKKGKNVKMFGYSRGVSVTAKRNG